MEELAWRGAQGQAPPSQQGIVGGQLRVLGSRFARLGYRAGRVLRSHAGSLLLRMAVLRIWNPA